MAVAHTVLARRWRPRSFSEVVGQDATVKALEYALAQKCTHHAYLFSGIRGTGKTSLARLLAQGLNCLKQEYPPCGQCSVCQQIDLDAVPDILEIDAASRTRVEETRDLLDSLDYPPQEAPYRIFIIDEVHMLSAHSFNALLKSLEEPPSHVRFILATTEPDRLPETVRSRLLHFKLRPLSEELLSAHLALIATEENIPYEIEALSLIARKAEGSLRDALTFAEQVIHVGGGKILCSSVSDLLGLFPAAVIETIWKNIINNNLVALQTELDALIARGTDFEALVSDMADYLHKTEKMRVVGELDAAHVLAEFSSEKLHRAYQSLLAGRRDLRFAPNIAVGFQMLIYRLCLLCVHLAPEKQRRPAPIVGKVSEELVVEPKKNIGGTYTDKLLTEAEWEAFLQAHTLLGLPKMLLMHLIWQNCTENTIYCGLAIQHAAMQTEIAEKAITNALSTYFEKNISLKITLLADDTGEETPYQRLKRADEISRQKEQTAAMTHPVTETIHSVFEGVVIEDIRSGELS